MNSRENWTIFLFEDFNIPHVKGVEGKGFSPESSPSCVTTKSLTHNLLTQIMDQPTRFKHQQQPSFLELVVTNDPERIISTFYHPAIGSSFHIYVLTENQVNFKKEN